MGSCLVSSTIYLKVFIQLHVLYMLKPTNWVFLDNAEEITDGL